jgi:hypothetical protein
MRWRRKRQKPADQPGINSGPHCVQRRQRGFDAPGRCDKGDET